MQFLTAKSLLYLRVIFLITIAFYLIKDPEYLGNSGFVILLGQAMQVPYAKIEASNPLLGMVSALFMYLALSDLIPLLADNLGYFETIVPTRLTGYFGLASFAYFSKNKYFSSSIIFVYAFFEIWFNFLIFNNLRDEKYYRIKKFVEENADEIRQAQDDQVRVVEIEH